MLYINDEPLKTGKFPNGETYVELGNLKDSANQVITMIYESNDDLINLMLLKRSLDDNGAKNISLISPFFPYSTMDRSENIRSLSCKYISEFINLMGFAKVEIWEAHSAVILATLDRVHNIENISSNIAKSVIEKLISSKEANDILIVYPDSGAEKRYSKSFQDFKYVVMKKSRDFVTGKITDMEISHGSENLQSDMTAIIVDDLCRAGRTFLKAAEYLKKSKIAKKVILCVTHCEEVFFTGELYKSNAVDIIYTTDSCCAYRDDKKVKFIKTIRT